MFINPFNVTAPDRADGRVPRRRSSAGQPLVLVVEDHDDTRYLLRMMAEMWGCRVMEACDGLEAVEIAGLERPELILMDSSLPLLDSLAAARRMRDDELLRGVLIVALSGWATPDFRAAALAAGCDACLDKPIDFKRLESLLAHLSDTPQAAASSRAAPAAISNVDDKTHITH